MSYNYIRAQDTEESCQQFFIRNFFITQCALQATEEAGGNVLLLGHAATLDTCSRQLVGSTSPHPAPPVSFPNCLL